MGELILSTPWLLRHIAFGAASVMAIIWMARVIWLWTGHRRAVAAVESLRVLAAAMIAATLLAPELVRYIVKDRKPVLAVLRDASDSMASKDIMPPQSTTQTRSAWIDAFLANQTLWEPVRARFDIVSEEFAATLPMDKSKLNAPKSTDIAGALTEAVSRNRDVEAVLTLTDGQWNRGGPPSDAATRLASTGIAVYAVAVGSSDALPDLRIAKVGAPKGVLLGDFVSIQALVVNQLKKPFAGELTLKDDSGATVARRAMDLRPGAEEWIPLVWEPVKPGDFTLKLTLPAMEEEIDKANNVAEAKVSVRKETIKVLLVEGEPRWEFRFLRNALVRDQGIDVDCLLLRPSIGKPADGDGFLTQFPTRGKLSEYDVVFLGDVKTAPGSFEADDARSAAEHVLVGGAGLVLMPGRSGRLAELLASTKELADACPVTLDNARPDGVGLDMPERTLVTIAGAKSLLTRLAGDERESERVWADLPGFQWRAAVEHVKGDADVLAVAESADAKGGSAPLMASRPLGEGLVLFMGADNAWRWRKGVEDLRHYRFWAQVIRCMARKRHLSRTTLGAISHSPETPEALQEVSVQATLLDKQGMPSLGTAAVMRIHKPDGTTSKVPMVELPGGWGVYRAGFTPESGGAHTVNVSIQGDAGPPMKTEIPVSGAVSERIGEAVNSAALSDMTRAGGGRCATWSEASALLSELSRLPAREPEQLTTRIWCSWWWITLIALVLAGHWAGRKRIGLP